MNLTYTEEEMKDIFDFWCQLLVGTNLSMDDVDEYTMITSDCNENLLYITDTLSGEIIDIYTIH